MDGEWLEEQLRRGLSIYSMARLAERSPSTVGYWLKRHGLSANGSATFGPQERIDVSTLRQLLESGASVSEMARALECSPDRLRRQLRKLGLETRRAANREASTQAASAGVQSLRLQCATHGPTRHVREGRGAFRCAACRSEQVTLHRRKLKRRLVELAGGSCAICGYDRCDGALQFHHLDPAEKAFALSRHGVTRSWARASAEAAKCALLCANCHAEVEAGVSEVPSAALQTPRGGLEPPNLD